MVTWFCSPNDDDTFEACIATKPICGVGVMLPKWLLYVYRIAFESDNFDEHAQAHQKR